MRQETPAPAPAHARDTDVVDAVVIGRNEGQRLIDCLTSLRGAVRNIVYVDSGSSDGSVAAARAAGAHIVELDPSRPFTAARARNAGLAALPVDNPAPYVQMIDGDCSLQPGWIAAARAFLDDRPDVAVACGRRRERYPQASIYNRMCDWEWDTPIGAAESCGGDALMRRAALDAAGSYDAALIAGEEPELCLRLRHSGWKIRRLDAEMTAHDADMHSMGQWWQRNRRAGFAYGQVAAKHAGAFRGQRRRIWLWGVMVPAVAIAGLGASLWLTLGAGALYAASIGRMGWRLRARSWRARHALGGALLIALGRFAGLQGLLTWHLQARRGGHARIIEYK